MAMMFFRNRELHWQMAYDNGMLFECMYVPKNCKRNITQHTAHDLVGGIYANGRCDAARPELEKQESPKFRHDTQTQYYSEKKTPHRNTLHVSMIQNGKAEERKKKKAPYVARIGTRR